MTHDIDHTHAQVGDWIEVDTIGGGPSRRGMVVEVLGTTSHPHYRVRWDEQHESLHFPAQGTRVLHEAAEHEGSRGHPR